MSSFIDSSLFPRRSAIKCLGALLAGFSMPLPAQTRIRRSEPARYAIFDADIASHRLTRRLLDADDEHRYQIFTAIPQQTPPAEGFPVIYMLDGNAVFDRLTAEMLAQAGGLVIVGIGYPTPMTIDAVSRSRDFTPPLPEGVAGDARDQGRPIGGAADFLSMLQGGIRAAAEEGLPIDPLRRSIWGHSYGGLFCLYTLLSAPDAFKRYIPTSPSCGWGDGLLQKMAPQAAARDIRQYGAADVLVMLGDSEVRSGSGEPPPQKPSPATMALVDVLRQRDDLRVDVQVFAGLGHGATFAASFPRALALAGK